MMASSKHSKFQKIKFPSASSEWELHHVRLTPSTQTGPQTISQLFHWKVKFKNQCCGSILTCNQCCGARAVKIRTYLLEPEPVEMNRLRSIAVWLRGSEVEDLRHFLKIFLIAGLGPVLCSGQTGQAEKAARRLFIGGIEDDDQAKKSQPQWGTCGSRPTGLQPPRLPSALQCRTGTLLLLQTRGLPLRRALFQLAPK